jgi:hypothetical protein
LALLTITRDPPPRQVRQFAMVWLPGLCFVLAGLALYSYDSRPAAIVLVGSAITSFVLGLLRPGWMRPVMLAVALATFPLGWLVLHLLLAVLYYGVVTPIGVAMRLVGRDPLARHFDRAAQTYWSPRRLPPEPSRYFRQF